MGCLMKYQKKGKAYIYKQDLKDTLKIFISKVFRYVDR